MKISLYGDFLVANKNAKYTIIRKKIKFQMKLILFDFRNFNHLGGGCPDRTERWITGLAVCQDQGKGLGKY